MSTSLIYKHSALYNLVNHALYGRYYRAHYKAVADLIPERSSVVDLCCGSAMLYFQYLRAKSVRYVGLDISPHFVDSLNKRGGRGLVWDLRSEQPLPSADYVVIQGALYFFLPDPSSTIRRMLVAAAKQAIIAEPIRNLSTSRFGVVSTLAMRLAGAVKGNHPVRYTEETLDAFFECYSSNLALSFKVPGGRDKVYVLDKVGAAAVVH